MGKCIFFDQDGTLVDSGEGIIKCVQLALNHFGIEGYTPEQLRVFVGPPLRKMFVEFGVPADRAEEAITVYRSRYYTIGKYEACLYEGIGELLDRLKADGHRLFVATSKPEKLAFDVLTHFDLDRRFERVCGATEDGRIDTKEDVIAYLRTQAELGDECIMVGDTHYDVLGAKIHGIPTVGVSWGYGTVEEMEEAGAVAIANTMEELYSLINRL